MMEHMISQGVPQRSAHGLVGQLVRLALDRGVTLADLSIEDFQSVDQRLDKSVYEVLGAKQAVSAFVSYGSTSPKQVATQLAAWKTRLEIS